MSKFALVIQVLRMACPQLLLADDSEQALLVRVVVENLRRSPRKDFLHTRHSSKRVARVLIMRVTFLSIRRAWRWHGSQVYAPGGRADGKTDEKMESW